MTDTIYIVLKRGAGYDQWRDDLRAFESEEAAKEWRDEYVEKYDWDEEEEAYHIGMGGYARVQVTELEIERW